MNTSARVKFRGKLGMKETGPSEGWGLCATCSHARPVHHPRGAEAYCMCGLAESDPQYDKYPRLPVLKCPGYAREETD